MKTCPFCNSEYKEKNDGKGIYYQCIGCGSKIFNLPLLKRIGFDSKLFKKFLITSRQNPLDSRGHCVSCENVLRKVTHETNGYQASIFVCPTCHEFAIKKMDIPLFESKQDIESKPARRYSPEVEKVMNEVDLELSTKEESWRNFDQTMKISKRRAFGSLIVVFLLILLFIKVGLKYVITSISGTVLFIFLFLICFAVVMYFILGGKNIIETVKKYFSRI